MPQLAALSSLAVLVAAALCVHCQAADTAQPAWLTSTLYDDYGRSDRVPLPWTPVVCEGQTVSMWGRTFGWTGESLLPASMTTQGVELLQAPMALIVTLDGRDHAIPLDRFDVTERKRTRVSFTAAGAVQGIEAVAEMWVEYDGLLWVDLLLNDRQAGRRVEGLRVAASLSPAGTTLYQGFSRALAGGVGAAPIRFPWMSDEKNQIIDFYHWFGNEDRGLGFVYTSQEHWAPASDDDIATLRPGDRETTYTINLIQQPVTVSGRAFRFGIQATPIKPLPPDYHAMMTATFYTDPWRASVQLADQMDMVLIWPLDTGIMKGLNDPYGVKAEAMQRTVTAARERGYPILNVAACPQKVSAQVPELAQYREDWQVLPESTLEWDGELQVQNCGRSETLRRWLFYGWGVENVQKFGLDGLYFDGWQAGSIACRNPSHGCGWTDEAGNRHLTVPVLEGREWNQRMLLFIQDHAVGASAAGAPERPGFPKGRFWIHSWEFVPPVMGFATDWLTGEFAGYPLQGPSMLKPEGTYGKCLGLDLFRARCLSTNWGVPNHFHALMWECNKDQPERRQTQIAHAWFLPHGVPRGAVHYMNQKATVEISRVLVDFGVRRAVFTPCWRSNGQFAIEAPQRRDVVVATWVHDPAPAEGASVLAVVSNLDPEAEHAVVLRWLGEAGARFHDARTGEPLPAQGGRLTLDIAAEDFVLISATLPR